MRPLTRRAFLGQASAAMALPWALQAVGGPAAAHAAPVASGWGDAQYWAFADRVQAQLEKDWSPHERMYDLGASAGETSINANLLYVHAAAALSGHKGLCRNDERAAALARRLCESPPYLVGSTDRLLFAHKALAHLIEGDDPTAELIAHADRDQTHPWGWGNQMRGTGGQHVVIDAAVAAGLAMAFRARDVLHLPESTVAAIRDRVSRCAYSTFYEFPSLRLNQINWPIEIYTAAAEVTGETQLLAHDTRLQLSRFARALTHRIAPWKMPFTGPGYRFHYLPHLPNSRVNLDSAEYASIVCKSILFYEGARRAGMRPLSKREEATMRAWVDRVMCGYWTHAGYLNWDTGLSFDRWHQGKKHGLCLPALLAVAASPRFRPQPAYAGWAKSMFDQGLALYGRWMDEAHGLPPAVCFGIRRTERARGDDVLHAARISCDAAQAVIWGLGRMRSHTPPPLYAYDPDIGRLAVTTPSYNTAVLAVNMGAVPYGGMELARLYDGRQCVAAGVGGVPPAAFGVSVIDHRSGRRTESQRGRRRPSLRRPPLRLTRAPRGTGRHLAAYPRHAYAGPFTHLDAEGWTTSGTAAIRTRHRFRRDWIESEWTIVPRGGSRRQTARVLFPSWGRHATITAVLADGRRVPVRSGRVALAGVRWFEVQGKDTGYVVVLRGRVPGYARLLHPTPQSSAPDPGPTLALEVLTRARSRRRRVTVRVAPAGPREAAGVAAALARG
jgi:hypothetical protein